MSGDSTLTQYNMAPTRSDEEPTSSPPQTSTSYEDEALASRRLFERYRDRQQSWAKQAAEDAAFVNGDHWTEQQIRVLKGRGQAPLSIPLVASKVEQAVGMMTANSPRFQATARENSDSQKAAIFADLLQWVWQESDGDLALKQVCHDYYARSRGVLHAYIDPNADMGKGEVFIDAASPMEVFPDPNSRDPYCRDAAHIIVAKTLSKEQLKNAYPHKDLDTLLKNAKQEEEDFEPGTERRELHEQETGPVYDRDSEHYLLLDRYTKVQVPFTHAYDSTTGAEELLNEEEFEEYKERPAVQVQSAQGEEIITEQEEVAFYGNLLSSFGPVLHMQPSSVPGQGPNFAPGEGNEQNTIVITPLTYEDLIERDVIVTNRIIQDRVKRCVTVGDEKLHESIMPTQHYPIVTIPNGHKRNPYPAGDIRLVRDLQEAYNKTQSLILAHTANSTNVKVFVPRGGYDREELEEQFSRAGASIMEYDPNVAGNAGIVVVSPVPLPNELYTNQDRFERQMETVLGLYSLGQGDPSQAPETYRSLISLEEFGHRRIQSKLDNILGGVNQLAKCVVELIQSTYTEEKTFRLVQPHGEDKTVKLNETIYDDFGRAIEKVNDVTVGRYDVMVTSGSTLPSNRWARLEEYKQMYEIGLVDELTVLQHTDLAHPQKVYERVSQLRQLSSENEQLKEQIKDLQGDLQTATREAVNANKREEVTEFESQLDEILTQARAETEIQRRELQSVLNDLRKAGNNSNNNQD